MAYCTQTDLELAVGGAAALVEQLDKDGDGVADAAFVTAVLNRASAEVSSAVQLAVDLSTLSAPYPDTLVYVTADIASYYAWLEGGQGIAVPGHIRDKYQDALRWLDQVAKRERSLGVMPRSVSEKDVKQIEVNSAGGSDAPAPCGTTGTRFSRSTSKGTIW